jgi:hypothetical protein
MTSSSGVKSEIPVERRCNMSLKNCFLALVALCMVVLTTGSHAQESEHCTNATLHGSYGLHATGTVPGGLPFAAVGRFTFDGTGNLTGKLFVRVDGNNIEPPEFAGTYSVHPDCTVTDTWGPPINSTHVSVIVDQGKGYVILNNTLTGGDTISGEARRQ